MDRLNQSQPKPVFIERVLPHLISMGVVAAFTGLQLLVWPAIDPAPFLLFYPAVIVCALIGDGVMGTLLSALAIQLFFVSPQLGKFSWPQDAVRLAIFLASAFALTHLVRAFHRAHQRVGDQAQFFNRALEATTDFIYVFDLSGRFLFANRPLLRLWNKSLGEVIGKTFAELGYPSELVGLHARQIEEVRQKKNAVRGENYFTDASGRTGYFEYVLAPVLDSNGEIEFISGVTRDTTERKKSEVQLREAVEAREEVLSIVSHDLRNPLGAILMNVSLLRRRAPGLDAFGSSLLDKVERAGRRMNEMIEDLLSLARIEAGTFAVVRREICGCDIVTEAIEMTKPFADEKHIRIETEGVDQPLQMACDHQQVLRVFSNLISNAVKFTPEYGLIRVTAEDRPGEVLFSVSDTGPGIAAHHLPQVFDRFWQAKKTTGSGAGLGLMISKGIVEAHGGRIWVESQFGSGATFRFSLPKAPAKTAAA